MDKQALLARLSALPISGERKLILARGIDWIDDLAECMRSREARASCAERSPAWYRLLYVKGFAASYCEPWRHDILTARIAGYFDLPELMLAIDGWNINQELSDEFDYATLASGRVITPERAMTFAQNSRIRGDISSALALAGVTARDAFRTFGTCIEPVYESPEWIDEILGNGNDAEPFALHLRERIMCEMREINEDPLVSPKFGCSSRLLLAFLDNSLTVPRSRIMLQIATIDDWNDPLLEFVRTRDPCVRRDVALQQFDAIIVGILLCNRNLDFVARMLMHMNIAGVVPRARFSRYVLDDGIAHVRNIIAMYRALGHPFTPEILADIVNAARTRSLYPYCEEDFAEMM